MKEFDFTTTPIVDIVNDIIIDAVLKNASDIHFDPSENYLRIRVRIDGDLRDYSIIQNKYKRNLITRVKLLAGMNITESRLPQDGAIKSTIEGKDLDLRVSALPTNFGEKVVIRILDYSMSFQGIESLGFSSQNYKLIEKMLLNPNGIILVTGATGSGKSTTVYSMLQRLNKEETNIITVEDPVEMNIEGINQIQVNSDIGLDFATVLRSILRQDPNIILIGEIRDSETAKIAIRASITGHLVLSTLHTNNSLTTIERLLDMDVERYLLSSSLKGIISQNLAKRLCMKCRKKIKADETQKRMFKKALGIDVDEIYTAVGCSECHNGYRGRVAVQEVLLINDDIRDAINNNIPRDELRKLIYKNDVKTLFQDGLLKVIEGITTFEEVFRIVDVEDDASGILRSEKNNEEKTKIETLDTTIVDTNEVLDIPKMDEIKKENIVISNKQMEELRENNIFNSMRKEEDNKILAVESSDILEDKMVNEQINQTPIFKNELPNNIVAQPELNEMNFDVINKPTFKENMPATNIIESPKEKQEILNTPEPLGINDKYQEQNNSYTDNLINLINKDLF